MSKKANEQDALDASWGVSGDGQETQETQPNKTSSTSIQQVQDTVIDEFDERTWWATEAGLSVHSTLLLDGVQACAGLVIEGPSGSGKTTVLRLFEDATYDGEDLVYRSDDMTPAAFVSHDAAREDEEMQESDLLPNIRHKMLSNPDMASWFAGDFSSIYKNMAYLARAMDGTGLITDSGAHGQRGYEGDYRFALMAATTPLEHRAWDVMGTVGNRLLFHEMPRKDDMGAVTQDVFEGGEYGEKVDRCRSVVSHCLNTLWRDHGGYGSVTWTAKASEDVRDGIAYLANLICHARTPTNGTRESPHRVMSTLRNTARGHALLYDRTELRMEDVEVCARMALSTMHKERRGIVRAVVDPDIQSPITSTEIVEHEATEATKKTIIERMELLQTLGIGEVTEGMTGRNTKSFVVGIDFVWPDNLPYPRFG